MPVIPRQEPSSAETSSGVVDCSLLKAEESPPFFTSLAFGFTACPLYASAGMSDSDGRRPNVSRMSRTGRNLVHDGSGWYSESTVEAARKDQRCARKVRSCCSCWTEVGDDPMAFSQLNLIQSQRHGFRSSQTASEQQTNQRRVSSAAYGVPRNGVQEVLGLISRQPIANPCAEPLAPLHSVDSDCQFRAQHAALRSFIG